MNSLDGPLRRASVLLVALLVSTTCVEAQLQWRRIGFGLGDHEIRSLALSIKGDPFAATLDGIIRIDSVTMTGVVVAPVPTSALLTLSGGTMIAFGDSVMRSDDDGTSWTVHSNTRTEGSITAARDGVLYRVRRARLSRSFDTARSWQLLDTGETMYTHSVVALSDGSVIANAPSSSRRSTDHGTTWSTLPSKSMQAAVETATGTLVAVIDGHVNRSTDGGMTWTVGQQLRFRSLVAARDGTLYGAEDAAYDWRGRGTYRSTNDGRSWSHVMSAQPYRLAATSSTSLWWAHGNRVYHSDGSQRPPTQVDLEPHMYRGPVTDVAVDPDGTLYAATPSVVEPALSSSVWHAALSRSTDNGSSWTFLRDSISAGILAPYPGTVLARLTFIELTSGHSNRIDTRMARTTDAGTSWSRVAGSPIDATWRADGIMAVASLPTFEFEAYTYAGELMISSDYGRAWRATGTKEHWRSVLITRTGTLVAGVMASGGGISQPPQAAHLRSTDAGTTWTRSNDSVVFTEISEGRDGTLFAFGSTLAADNRGGYSASFAGIYRSTDDGATWTSRVDSTGYLFAKSAFAYSRSGTILAHVDFRFFRSVDNGASWTEISIGEYRHPYSVHIDSTDALLIASGNLIHRSTDDGITWTELSRGVPSGTSSKLVIAPDGALIVATSDGGLWRSDGPASTEARPGIHAGALSIAPNPLSGRGSITLTLVRSASVRASLTDAVGRCVSVVHDGRLDAGSHVLPLDVGSLSAGPYLLHVRGDETSHTRLVIVE